VSISTLRYRSQKFFGEVLRRRLREVAGTHVRYGYRRLTVLLRREGWLVNAKRIYRLYREEALIVRTKQRRKIARRQRAMTTDLAVRPNQWSTDFVSDKLARWALVPHSHDRRPIHAGVCGTGSGSLYPAWPPCGERRHREFQRPAARRVSERGVVLFTGRCAAKTG